MTIQNLLKEKQGIIVDVRTHEEFMGGHVADAINIPVSEIQNRLDEIRELKMPLVLCCASGNRSDQVQQFLSGMRLECYNAGSWLDVNYYQSK